MVRVVWADEGLDAPLFSRRLRMGRFGCVSLGAFGGARAGRDGLLQLSFYIFYSSSSCFFCYSLIVEVRGAWLGAGAHSPARSACRPPLPPLPSALRLLSYLSSHMRRSPPDSPINSPFPLSRSVIMIVVHRYRSLYSQFPLSPASPFRKAIHCYTHTRKHESHPLLTPRGPLLLLLLLLLSLSPCTGQRRSAAAALKTWRLGFLLLTPRRKGSPPRPPPRRARRGWRLPAAGWPGWRPCRP